MNGFTTQYLRLACESYASSKHSLIQSDSMNRLSTNLPFTCLLIPPQTSYGRVWRRNFLSLRNILSLYLWLLRIVSFSRHLQSLLNAHFLLCVSASCFSHSHLSSPFPVPPLFPRLPTHFWWDFLFIQRFLSPLWWRQWEMNNPSPHFNSLVYISWAYNTLGTSTTQTPLGTMFVFNLLFVWFWHLVFRLQIFSWSDWLGCALLHSFGMEHCISSLSS